MLGFALLFRVIGVFTFPILEDDMYRYLWDGYMTVESGSPYSVPPIDFFDADNLSDRLEHILGLINYPGVATIYGPVCQWVFALGYLIAPGEIWPLQLIFTLADLLLILTLLRLAKPTTVLLYAWSPLIIKEFSITAHPDVLGALFLILAVVLYQHRRFFGVGCLIALAAGVKVFAVILLPFLLGFKWRGWLAFLVTGALIALPFGIEQAWLPAGLRAMGSSWLFNAPLYELLANWFSVNTVKALLLAIFALGSGIYALKTIFNPTLFNDQIQHSPNHIPRGDLLFAGLFLTIPALNAWYLVWLLPFAVIRPSLWAWVASVSILLSYASGINLPHTELEPYEHSKWVLAVEFGIILLAASMQKSQRFLAK